MLLGIEKIKVADRIRKDLGNIQELANDIKENGLINPPVTTPEYKLIAGERRVKACILLGYQQIEVRVMTVRDYEHQLKLEISENENRKEFTFTERVNWAKRLEQVERLKAKERQELGVRENFPEGAAGRTRDIVANQSGFGSGKQYEKAKFIAENARPELIKQLDENQISIHGAYQELKTRAEKAESEAHALRQQLTEAHNKQPEVIERQVEVIPSDVERELLNARVAITDHNRLSDENKRLKLELEATKASTLNGTLTMEAKVSTFTGRIKIFLREMAPLGYLGHEVMGTSPQAQKEYERAIAALERWCGDMRDAMVRPREEKTIDVEVMK